MVEVDLNEVKEDLLNDFAGTDTEGLTKLDVLSIVCSQVLEHCYEINSRRRRGRALSGEEARPARRRRVAVAEPGPGPAIDLRLGPGGDIPSDVRSHIEGLGGSSILLVCEKVVTESDVKRSQRRLLMPPSTIRSPSFLSEDERELLETRAGTNVSEMRVPLLETTFETHEVSLRRWEMRRGEDKSTVTVCYVLTGGWNEVVVRNGIEKGDLLQVWSFRVGAWLQLALVAAHNYGR